MKNEIIRAVGYSSSCFATIFMKNQRLFFKKYELLR